MYRVIECLIQQHDYGLVAVAALVCIIGSYLSILMSFRLTQGTGKRKILQLLLTSLIAGATIWSTHFIAMLAYEPAYPHGYEPVATGMSLGIAVLGLIAANGILAYTRQWPFALLSGAVFGLTICAMHYLGMSAYLLPGQLIWDPIQVLASLILGVTLGALAHHRIVFPVTRYCWMEATFFMVLAICAMHFTGMSAFSIEFNPLIQVPPQVISDPTLGVLILGVTILILLLGFASFSIETNLEHQARDQLHRAALRDPLTGLPNRMHLTQEMTELTNRLQRDQTERVAVLTIDLNMFKEVNDLHGHATGDAVLQLVANRLSAALEQHEFVARTGGDEFVAFKSSFRRVDQVMAFAERLHALIIDPMVIGEVSTSVGAAIGIATSIEDGRDLRELLHNSNLAMYRAKVEPERHICLFNVEMDQQSRDKLLLINDLRRACENGEFELAYQLQNDLKTLEPIGFEVLLRWQHPIRGRISPEIFIPLAEETGLIRDIGLWVLRTACIEAMKWPEPFSVAVNVAPQQLVQPSFLEHVSDILFETRLPPDRLELEVTEASIIDDHAHTLRVMHKLKKMGIRIAMDDFGTGYSSLAMLQTFPFDKIKIDRSFIQNVHKDQQRAAIVRSTLLLGAALDIPVLAEGVEIEDELTFLRTENCNAVQGFYFGKPMSRDQLHQCFKRSEPKTGS